jgi:aminoglycoside N3'-acetyltransferase
MIGRLFVACPLLEVLSRYIYWKFLFVRKFIYKIKKKKKSLKTHLGSHREEISTTLKDFGIHKGDILIVHSSYENLLRLNIKATELFDIIQDLIGVNGTLVMPAYPNILIDELSLWQKKSKKVNFYDVKKTIAWTGVLPNLLMRKPGAIRSEHPVNSLVAQGAHAAEMMKDNLHAGAYPCGQNSAWAYCWSKNAKILSLGIEMKSCITMIHLNEDINPDQWPIKNWYEFQSYLIRNNEKEVFLELPVRRPRWGLHYCGSLFDRDMLNENILIKRKIKDVPFECINSESLISFLKLKNKIIPGYPFLYCSYVKFPDD